MKLRYMRISTSDVLSGIRVDLCSRFANYKQMCFDDFLSSVWSPLTKHKFTD